MADEQHGGARGDEATEVVEQLVHFLRHQHGGGFVENQRLGTAIEHLQNLDTLALSDAKFSDRQVDVDLHTETLSKFLHAFFSLASIDDTALARLGAEDDVLQHGEVVSEHEVLVHHADAGRDRVAR